PHRVAGDLDGGEGVEQLLQEHPPLQAGQVHAEAEVLPDAETEVGVGVATNVEAVGVVEHRRVAVGRRVVRDHLVAGGDGGPAQLDVGGGGAAEAVQRVGPAEDLLDRPGD